MKREKNGFTHKHSLGQNFLTDGNLLERLADLSNVGENDRVLEIGAGDGAMTKVLARRCEKVLSIEIDEALMPILRVAMIHDPNVQLVHGDVMRLNLPELTKELGPFHVVANIPYYITTDLMNLLLSSGMPILSINLMVQKEAAERIVARPGEEGYGILAIKSQYDYDPAIALDVPACMFTPPPKVDSVFVTMPGRVQPKVKVTDEALFFRIASCAFAMRRKTMANNLIAAFRLSREQVEGWLAACGISATARGETLSMQDFANLVNTWPEQK